MLLPINGKLVIKEYTPKTNNGIYMNFKNNYQYMVSAISKEEKNFKIGDVIIIEETKLLQVDYNNETYYIADTKDVAAKVVEDE